MSSRLALAAATALAGLALLAPATRAAYDPLGSGVTRVTLDRSFVALLKQHGVKLSASAPARLDGRAVSFPVAGGKLDPTTGRGLVEHEGALVFEAGTRSLPLRDWQLKTTQRRSPLSAKVGGSQLKLAGGAALRASRQGFGEKIEIAGLSLSAKLATRLTKKLRLRRGILHEGLALGSSRTRANPETITLLGKGRASLAPAPEFAAKLTSLFVAVNPIFPAEHPGAEFTLPISGGGISTDGALGKVETSGSLEFLQLGGGQVFWADEWLDLAAHTASPEVNVQPSPPYAGKLDRVPVASLALTSPALANPKARTVSISTSLTLDAATAATFNEVFAKPQGRDGVFATGEPLGDLSFVAQGQ